MKICPCRLRSLVILAALFSATQAAAATVSPTIVVSNLQLAPSATPTMATLDVTFESTSAAGIPIAGFQLELAILGPDDAVKFSGVVAPQTRTYLFAGDSSGPLASIEADGLHLTMGDFLDTGFGDIVSGVGLATIQIEVEPAAAGKTYEVRINSDPAVSFLAVDSTTFVPFGARSGNISLVPEPSALALATLLAVVTSSLRLAKRSFAHGGERAR